MNKLYIINVLGKITAFEIFFMTISMFVSLYYHEQAYLSFLYSILCMLPIALCSLITAPKKGRVGVKDGFVVVSLSWILISVFGSLPYVFSGVLPNFADALYESVSGFTTTGATVIKDIEAVARGVVFWRALSHFIGGMGVLMLLLTIRSSASGESIHLLRAEVPGPSVEKLVPKIADTAKLLYAIYCVLSLLLLSILFLLGMPFFDAVTMTFSTAGTGGFSIYNDSVASLSIAIQYTLGIFMLLFALNFSLFYFLIIKDFKQIFKNEEMKYFLMIVFVAIASIFISKLSEMGASELLFRDVFFTVSSVISTTGFSTTDFTLWNTFALNILFVLMFVGGSTGSTSGGIKISRMILLVKAMVRQVRKIASPNRFSMIKLEGKVVDEAIVESSLLYMVLYFIVIFFFTMLISLEGFDYFTTFSFVVGSFNNVGQGLGMIGPVEGPAIFSDASKYVLSVIMLLGRLEIYPIMILFSFGTWRKLG